MRYAQVKAGQKLHLVFEGGEGFSPDELISAGYISAPLCNRSWDGRYRMTINVPLAYACRNCLRVWRNHQQTIISSGLPQIVI